MRHHGIILALAAAAVAAAFLLEVQDDERVAFRFLPETPLPQTCGSRAWFGLSCPGCGLTRSVVLLAAGDWAGSWAQHRLGWLAAAVILFQFPYRIIALARPGRFDLRPPFTTAFSRVTIGLLLGNWVVNLMLARQ